MSNTTKQPASPATNPPTDASLSYWGRSVRDTVEAFAIAFALAFLFKTFEAEAFVIPTGSMAPTLMGRHKDVVCPECGYAYTASCSEETDDNGNLIRTQTGEVDPRYQVVECTCPNCRFAMSVDPNDAADGEFELQKSYSGDRIWVSKVPYQFSEPCRWDVIVFRCPLKAETYFIKRLVGLPNERLMIEHGDIFAQGPADGAFKLVRKPPEKMQALAQVVHDNDHISSALREAGWPARWSSMPEPPDVSGAWKPSDDGHSFATDGSAGETWLRYEHRVPTDRFWRNPQIGASAIRQLARPQLITDFYAFNSRVLRRDENYGMMASALGLHWVGDLLIECEADVRGSQGELLLDLVKGGRHFRCAIDVATGRATLSIDGLDDWRRTAETSLRGPGNYDLRFANVDRQLALWIDGKSIAFDQPAEYADLQNERPLSTPSDPGDLAPVGIGSRNAAVEVRHLRVLRDIYYIADGSLESAAPITDFRAPRSMVPIYRNDELVEFLSTPSSWQTAGGRNLFDDRQSVAFELKQDQFFVLGDNSPASADARFWHGEHYVDRSLLVGKALCIYWPHPIDLPIPFVDASIGIIPNLPHMGLIR
ncbi:MAG: S26 family signal peptidase [Pirellulales bacterium]